MDQLLSVYLSMDRRHALATGTPLPEHTQGTALFADISGFTQLTETLTRELGPRRGAEELPRQLNLVYDALIQKVDDYGGSVIAFAGDAITCWFDQDSGLRATTCGFALQAAMQAFATVQLPSVGTTSLAMKVAVASGVVRRFLVGDPRVQVIDVLAGATLSRMAAAEQMAQKSEIVLEARTAQTLSESLEIEEWRTDERGARFAVISALRRTVAPQPWAPLVPGTLHPEELRPWLLPTVYERLQAGRGEFLTELRPAVALFLRFGGIDYDTDAEAGQKLDRYIRWVQSLLMQYEGTLLQFTIGEKGSYLYAAFGAPIAHEDDARRAALTALKLRTPPEELSFITETQIGLTQGMMRSGAYGGTTRRTYGSLGDEVNLAARLMQHARPGQIVASGRVQAATTTLFTWRSLEEVRVKGKSEPIPIFALVGARRAATIHLQEPGYTLPLVGRQRELGLIEEKLQYARQGQGQIVGITAEAGMGKSRLVAEVIRRAQGQGFAGYGGECHSFGINTPYLVWQPIWRALLALDEARPLAEQTESLEAQLTRLNPALLPRLPLLGNVLNLPLPENDLTLSLGAEQRKQSCEALLVDVLKARAATMPLLLVLEDTHWLDALSQELLDGLARAIWNLPVLIVLAYRPYEESAHSAPQALQLPYFSKVSLAALTSPEAAQLIDTKLTERRATHYEPLPRSIVEQFMERTEGNPFYIEELLNYLHEQGLDLYDPTVLARLDLPTSLHALILSRIDQLSEPQKITLKVASVIGRLFRFVWLCGYYPELGEPTEIRTHLEVLRRLDLTPLEQPEPDLTYLFKHSVTQEVAYESLTYETRARLHERLAEYLEEQETGSLVDLLAYHYERSQNLPKKRLYLEQAARASQAVYANASALQYYERLLPLLEEEMQSIRSDILLEMGRIQEVMGHWQTAEASYLEALTLSQATQDVSLQGRALLCLGSFLGKRGDYLQALGWLEQALSLCKSHTDQQGQSRVLTETGLVLWRQGSFTEAMYTLQEAFASARRENDARGMAAALNHLGNVTYLQGDYEEAARFHRESLILRQQGGSKVEISSSLNNLGRVVYEQGRYEEAKQYYQECILLDNELGDKWSIAIVRNNLGLVMQAQGHLGQARSLFAEALSLRLELGDKWGTAISLNNLGLVALLQGNLSEAHAYCHESLVRANALRDRLRIASALVGLASIDWRVAEGKMPPSLALPHRAVARLAQSRVLLDTLGARLDTNVRTLYEQALQASQCLLDATAFASAWAEGQSMSLERCLEEALEQKADDLFPPS